MRKSLLFLAAAALSTAAFAQVQLAPGEYFIRNVKTGKFLNQGFTWGSHGIVKDQAREFKITPATGGGYFFTTSSGYLKKDGNDLYMDGNETSTVELAKDGDYYTLTFAGALLAPEAEPYSFDWTDAEGKPTMVKPKSAIHNVVFVNEANEYTTWELLTRAKLVNELDAATEANPIDATFYLKAHNIDKADSDNGTAWNYTRNGEPVDMVFPDPGWGYPAGDWYNWQTYAWFHNDEAEGNVKLSQSVSDVLPGYYRAEYLLVNQDPAPLTITFNGKEGEVYNYTDRDLWYGSAYAAFVDPANEKQCVFEVGADRKLEIVMEKEEHASGNPDEQFQNRFAFKRFILSYLGTEKPAGIEGVAIEAVDADAPAVYYNMQGIRVAEPTTGLYIVRQGNKVSKQLIRK